MLTSATLPPPPNRRNELLGMGFEFPFNLIGKSTLAFLKGESWRVLKSWYARNKSSLPGPEVNLIKLLQVKLLF